MGIVSFGRGCANESYPGIYTRLTAFHDWIDTTINGAQTAETSSPLITSTIPLTSAVEEVSSPPTLPGEQQASTTSKGIEEKSTIHLSASTDRKSSPPAPTEQQVSTSTMEASHSTANISTSSTTSLSRFTTLESSSGVRSMFIGPWFSLFFSVLVVVATIDQ